MGVLQFTYGYNYGNDTDRMTGVTNSTDGLLGARREVLTHWDVCT